MEPYRYFPGRIPLIVSIPHAGTYVPEGILERFTPAAKQLPDTDWHGEQLYAFAREMGAHMLVATHSRYVVDVNRGADNASLYPGKFTTGICPTTLFDGSPLYQAGREPDEKEIRERIKTYWQPYHDKLESFIQSQAGRVIVFDAHSIKSEVSTLFDGTLPDLNLGTADGATIDAAIADKLIACCQKSLYSSVYNGRFKGGYITRNYGEPEANIHTVQLELAQKNYMQEAPPFAYDEAKAGRLQVVLKELLEVLSKETI